MGVRTAARQIAVGIWALASSALLGCGADDTVGKRCAADDSCNTGEVCSPSSGRCVRSCTGNAGCPSSQTCAPLPGSGSPDGGLSLKVCQ